MITIADAALSNKKKRSKPYPASCLCVKEEHGLNMQKNENQAQYGNSIAKYLTAPWTILLSLAFTFNVRQKLTILFCHMQKHNLKSFSRETSKCIKLSHHVQP
ncbi:hypothetical protein VNO77_24606 [Canavalia gladiata]|uniref:Uncharacterized protein n=1 Tax=Canavalia gladiata TaxID=3824 RepID=A0AAN9L957_CANGL